MARVILSLKMERAFGIAQGGVTAHVDRAAAFKVWRPSQRAAPIGGIRIENPDRDRSFGLPRDGLSKAIEKFELKLSSLESVISFVYAGSA